ncbi:hypothetical protein ES708_26416 [subsurface metagenome]
MKRFLNKKWHSIPVALLSALLVLALVAGGAFAAVYITEDQLITQEITEPYVPPDKDYGTIEAPTIDLPGIEVGETFGLVTGTVTVTVGPDGVGKWLHIRLDDTTVGAYDFFGANIRSEAADNPMVELVTIGVTYNVDPLVETWEMSTLLTAEGEYTFREFVCGTAGQTAQTAEVKLIFTLEGVPYVID